MDTIELSFVCEDSFGSKLIQWFTHSDFSHVDIIHDGKRIGARRDHPVNQNLPTDPIKMMRAGVQIRPMDYGKFTRDERVIIPAPNADYAYTWLSRQYGKPYDSEGLLRSFLFNQGRAVDWWDENQWWCSELAAVFVAQATGIRCATPASRVAPNDAFIFSNAVASCLSKA